jgi:hypothetical protein
MGSKIKSKGIFKGHLNGPLVTVSVQLYSGPKKLSPARRILIALSAMTYSKSKFGFGLCSPWTSFVSSLFAMGTVWQRLRALCLLRTFNVMR